MLTLIPSLLTVADCAAITADLAAAVWTDGRVTAGSQSAGVKANQQLPADSPVAQRWGSHIMDALGRSPRFVSAALPHRILPPMFNRYAGGGHFGTHVDNAIRPVGGSKLRTDLAATVFLADPASYEGGELTVETSFGAQRVKLPAGDMVLYPASSLHRVEAVTRGVRLASFFWVQSMVRDDAARALLFDLDQTIQRLGTELGANHRDATALTGTYHNLVRRWADT